VKNTIFEITNFVLSSRSISGQEAPPIPCGAQEPYRSAQAGVGSEAPDQVQWCSASSRSPESTFLPVPVSRIWRSVWRIQHDNDVTKACKIYWKCLPSLRVRPLAAECRHPG